jgi:hypothetical protein
MVKVETKQDFDKRMEDLCKSKAVTKGKYILDNNDNVQPVDDLSAWAEWIGSPQSCLKRVLCRTYLTPDIFVSTVFLAVDHSFQLYDDEPHVPVLWETMVFRNGSGDEQERYTTREQAIQGHLEMLDAARKLLEDKECQPKD